MKTRFLLLIAMMFVGVAWSQTVEVSINQNKFYYAPSFNDTLSHPKSDIFAIKLRNGNISVRLRKDGDPNGISFDGRILGWPYTIFRDGDNGGATFADADAVLDWFDQKTSFNPGSGGNGGTAALTTVEDQGDYYTGTNVEEVLAEIGAGGGAVIADGSVTEAKLSDELNNKFTPNYYKGKYDKVVIIGASIMEYSFGREDNTIDANSTQIFQDMGLDVDVYSYARLGYFYTNMVDKIEEAFLDHPDRTLFFIHSGGNNVTNMKPYDSSQDATFLTELNKVMSAIEPRKQDVVMSSITFRTYGNPYTSTTLYDDPSLGSQPYNDSIVIPRMKEVLPHNINSDGRPIVDLYNIVYNQSEFALSGDGIHMNGYGEDYLVEQIAERLKYFINGTTKPHPVPLLGDDVVVILGLEHDLNRNIEGYNMATLDSIGVPPFNLRRANGQSTSINLSISAVGVVGDYNVNTDGAEFGSYLFSRDLINIPAYKTTFYSKAGYGITYTLSGLTAGKDYKLGFVASRVTAEERVTKITANGNSAYIRTSIDPPQLPKHVIATADSSGGIIITQDAEVGGFSYLGGFSISEEVVDYGDEYNQLYLNGNNLSIYKGNEIDLSVLTSTKADLDSSPTFTGDVTATSFIGNGSQLYTPREDVTDSTYTLTLADRGKIKRFVSGAESIVISPLENPPHNYEVAIKQDSVTKAGTDWYVNLGITDSTHVRTKGVGSYMTLSYDDIRKQWEVINGEPYVYVTPYPNQFPERAGTEGNPDATSIADWLGSASITLNTNLTNVRTGTTSIEIDGLQNTQENIQWRFDTDANEGDTVKLSGWFKCASNIRVEGAVFQPYVASGLVYGNDDWQYFEVETVMDNSADTRAFVNLRPDDVAGPHTVWVDDLKVEYIPAP